MRVLLLSLIMVVICAATDDQQQREQGLALVQRAGRQLKLKKFEKPYRLIARVRLSGLRQAPIEGVYELSFKSTALWREDIRVPGYEETTVAIQNKQYTKRNVNYRPLRIHELRELMTMTVLVETQDVTVRKARRREKESNQQLCLDIQRPYAMTPAVACFDSAGDLQSYDAQLHDIPDLYEFGDYVEHDGMRLPRSRKLKIGKEVLVEVMDLEIIPGNPPDGAFQIPTGIEVYDTCDRQPAQRSDFQWNKLVPLQGRSWRVVAYYVAEKDGSLTNIKVLETNWPQIGELFVTNLRSKHIYVTCENQAIRIEGVVTFAADSGR